MRFDFYQNHFLFYFYIYKIYPNIIIKEKKNDIFILTSRSYVTNTFLV